MNYTHLEGRTNTQAYANGSCNLLLKTENSFTRGLSRGTECGPSECRLVRSRRGAPLTPATYPRAVAAKAAPAAPTSSQSL